MNLTGGMRAAATNDTGARAVGLFVPALYPSEALYPSADLYPRDELTISTNAGIRTAPDVTGGAR